jgi:hypothetical protein
VQHVGRAPTPAWPPDASRWGLAILAPQ